MQIPLVAQGELTELFLGLDGGSDKYMAKL